MGRGLGSLLTTRGSAARVLLVSVAMSRLGHAWAFSMGPVQLRSAFPGATSRSAHAFRAPQRFPVVSGASRQHFRVARSMASTPSVRSEYDKEQLRLLDSDECIIVNEKDEVRGASIPPDVRVSQCDFCAANHNM
jgi:hypothetical protein